jgi:multiple sugar transport system permease protein
MKISGIREYFNLEAHPSRLAFFLILPTMITVFGIMIFPLIYSYIISLTNASVTITNLEFVGLKNYIRAFRDNAVHHSFLITFKYVFVTVFLKLLLGLAVGSLLNKNFIGKAIARGLILMPWATPFVVSGLMWRWMYDPSNGVINFMLRKIGIISSNVRWLADVRLALPSVILVDVWKGSPFYILIILAGLQTIPEELYEAAVMDGAGKLKQFIRITLPMIRFPIFIVTILGTMFSMNQFDLFFTMTGGGPADYTKVITLYDWQMAFRFHNFSNAAAISYLILIVTFIITFIYFSILKKGEQ